MLTIVGDAQPNSITVSRSRRLRHPVNGGAVSVVGGTPTVANTSLIQAFGQGGDDTIALDETNGALPRANLFGGSGNDTLVGGSGADLIHGGDDDLALMGAMATNTFAHWSVVQWTSVR